MKTLDDMLRTFNAPDARRDRDTFDLICGPDGRPSGLSISSNRKPEFTDATDHRALIEESTDIVVPADMIVVMDRLSLKKDGSDWWYKYKFLPRPTSELITGIDAVKMLKDLRSNRKRPTPLYDGEASLNIAFNDWQAGKAQGGGTPALIERVHYCVADMVTRAKELKKLNRGVGTLNIFGIGDMVEGCFIYANQSFELDMDRRGQINVVTTLILHALDELAPYFSQVNVLVVPGNHGEHRVGGKKVNYTDNDDLLVFENAARAAERDPRLAHVKFIIAYGEVSKTMKVNQWVVGITHGQAFGNGSNPEMKAFNYLKAMAVGRQPLGDADLFVSAHYHHESGANWGATLWKQPPALDGGSQQFTDMSGKYALAGMQSWVMSPDSRYQDEFISYPPVKNAVDLAA